MDYSLLNVRAYLEVRVKDEGNFNDVGHRAFVDWVIYCVLIN